MLSVDVQQVLIKAQRREIYHSNLSKSFGNPSSSCIPFVVRQLENYSYLWGGTRHPPWGYPSAHNFRLFQNELDFVLESRLFFYPLAGGFLPSAGWSSTISHPSPLISQNRKADKSNARSEPNGRRFHFNLAIGRNQPNTITLHIYIYIDIPWWKLMVSNIFFCK